MRRPFETGAAATACLCLFLTACATPPRTVNYRPADTPTADSPEAAQGPDNPDRPFEVRQVWIGRAGCGGTIWSLHYEVEAVQENVDPKSDRIGISMISTFLDRDRKPRSARETGTYEPWSRQFVLHSADKVGRQPSPTTSSLYAVVDSEGSSLAGDLAPSSHCTATLSLGQDNGQALPLPNRPEVIGRYVAREKAWLEAQRLANMTPDEHAQERERLEARQAARNRMTGTVLKALFEGMMSDSAPAAPSSNRDDDGERDRMRSQYEEQQARDAAARAEQQRQSEAFQESLRRPNSLGW